jgi:hypothetical protein
MDKIKTREVFLIKDVRTKLFNEVKSLQEYIDQGVYDSADVSGMKYFEVIEEVSRRDFSAIDNLIWHYARITLLRELLGDGKYS